MLHRQNARVTAPQTGLPPNEATVICRHQQAKLLPSPCFPFQGRGTRSTATGTSSKPHLLLCIAPVCEGEREVAGVGAERVHAVGPRGADVVCEVAPLGVQVGRNVQAEQLWEAVRAGCHLGLQ